ncbi:MAG: TRAP transporter small permease [Rubrivivax sp.]|nr:TRAP transporter small permease [Rubrivivax sp.]
MNLLLRRLALVFALVGSGVAMLTGLMTVVSVAGRAAIAEPIPGDVELTQFGIALAISLGLPWCQLRGANIIVDFFTQRAAPRTQRWLDGIGALLLAIMCALLAWRTSVGAMSVREAQEQSMILELPMWWAYASLAPGLALAGVIALWQAWHHFTGRSLDGLLGLASRQGQAS